MRILTRLLIHSAILLNCSPALRGESKEYYFSTLTMEDGLSQHTVNCIFQDRSGIMWFGTRNGLNRYNGYSFDVFNAFPHARYSSWLSDSNILCMEEDGDGNIWVGTNTGLNRLDITTYQVERFYHDPLDANSIQHNTVTSICYVTGDNSMWIGTNNGLARLNMDDGRFERIDVPELGNPSITALRHKDGILYIGTNLYGALIWNIADGSHKLVRNDPDDPYSINNDMVRDVFIDRNENIWIATNQGGVSVRGKDSRGFCHYNSGNGLTNNFVRCVAESPEGKILVGTFDGLNVIDHDSGSITRYNDYDPGRGNLSYYSLYCIFFDRQDILWVGTYGGGVNYSNPFEKRFRLIDPTLELNKILGLTGPIVDHGETIFIANEGGGLLEYNLVSGKMVQHKIFETEENSFEQNIIKALFIDGDHIYCGTTLGTVYRFDVRTKKFTLFHDLGERKSIYYIGKSSVNDIIVGSVSMTAGLLLISANGEVRSTFPIAGYNTEEPFNNVRCVLEVSPNVFLIGTRYRGLYVYDFNTGKRGNYKRSEIGRTGSLPENYITGIIRDRSARIWICTMGGGLSLFDMASGQFENYGEPHGLLDGNICTILEDDNGHIWLSTVGNGISDFDPASGVFTNYTSESGIKVNEFTPHSGLKLSDGRIMFSGNNGITVFEPSAIIVNDYIPPVVLEGLSINNKPVLVGAADGILKKKLSSQDHIILKHDQSSFSIQYSSLNYAFAQNNQYSYMLEGFDRSWNDVDDRRIAYYTNISPGDYTFTVRGTNNDGLWNEQGASIRITIKPPYWKTWWAYCLYFLIFVAVLAFVIRYFREKRRLENNVRLKQMEARAQNEFHTARDRLFTNFSHELRMPLTLILNPLEDMMSDMDDMPVNKRHSLSLMRNNAQRLLRLVNNLMDFQKKEHGKIQLQAAEGDFVTFAGEMFIAFRELAEKREVNYTFETEEKLTAWFDVTLMEKVFFNLLSNAFKNVPNGGCVSVKIQELIEPDEKLIERIPAYSPVVPYIYVEISDNGVGIPPEHLEDIFIPFFQVAQNEHSSSGTGLGLSLSKSIIEMHHGNVWGENNPDRGASFRFVFPAVRECFSDNEITEEKTPDIPDVFIELPDQKTDADPDRLPDRQYTILIVEDNYDLRKYIVSHLVNQYNIQEAADGMQALEIIHKHLPDLVVTDLMMPKMDGMELCKRIKSDVNTSHIPVVMITARAMVSDILAGYETGADDYMPKPFSPKLLKARVQNIIRTRVQLKKIYQQSFSLETIGIDVSSSDERFMQRLNEVLIKNLDNLDLDQELLSKEIGMSKSNLYRTIKSVTGSSPTEFIRKYRLDVSVKMLLNTDMDISEVAVAVGFNTLSYFSNCFRLQYGMPPSKYVAMNKNKEDAN